ncbi:MAG: hypothetical protein L0Z62_31260 [Gemmataceae bacterium]|nr:hypothetical protein [Gemmataceae bacterium]
MSTTPAREYEFNQEQNSLIGALAGRMRGVGLFLIVIAILNFLVAALVILVIYRSKLPQNYVDAVIKAAGEAAKTDVQAQMANLPPDNHLWGIAIGSGVNFLLYLLIGMWTRQAARSFQQIVATRGNDITLLMSALSALNKMYTLVYTLILIGLLVLVASLGLFIYGQMTR